MSFIKFICENCDPRSAVFTKSILSPCRSQSGTATMIYRSILVVVQPACFGIGSKKAWSYDDPGPWVAGEYHPGRWKLDLTCVTVGSGRIGNCTLRFSRLEENIPASVSWRKCVEGWVRERIMSGVGTRRRGGYPRLVEWTYEASESKLDLIALRLFVTNPHP